MLPSPDAPHIPVAFPTRASGCEFHRAPRPQSGGPLVPLLAPLPSCSRGLSCLPLGSAVHSVPWSGPVRRPLLPSPSALPPSLPAAETYSLFRRKGIYTRLLWPYPPLLPPSGTRWPRAGVIPLLPQLVPVPQPRVLRTMLLTAAVHGSHPQFLSGPSPSAVQSAASTFCPLPGSLAWHAPQSILPLPPTPASFHRQTRSCQPGVPSLDSLQHRAKHLTVKGHAEATTAPRLLASGSVPHTCCCSAVLGPRAAHSLLCRGLAPSCSCLISLQRPFMVNT